jgi:hypothetical protein
MPRHHRENTFSMGSSRGMSSLRHRSIVNRRRPSMVLSMALSMVKFTSAIPLCRQERTRTHLRMEWDTKLRLVSSSRRQQELNMQRSSSSSSSINNSIRDRRLEIMEGMRGGTRDVRIVDVAVTVVGRSC